MEVLQIKKGDILTWNKEKTNFEFNFNGSEDVLKVSGDTDIETFGGLEVRMKFKLHSISATAWRSKPNISITIVDEDTGELFKLTQSYPNKKIL